MGHTWYIELPKFDTIEKRKSLEMTTATRETTAIFGNLEYPL